MKSLGIVAIMVLCAAVAVGTVMHMAPVNGSAALAANGGLQWHLHDDLGPLGEAPRISATATHYIDGGGSVAMEATCDDHTIALEFEYHAKQDDNANSRFEMQGTGGFVHTLYRADNGDIHEFVSQDDHPNSARVAFTYEMSDEATNGQIHQSGLAVAFGSALLPGLAPQDLRVFLHAQQTRFELPLGNGLKEVVVIDPSELRFKEFLSVCKINLNRLDDDAAKQQATDQAAAQAKAGEQARADQQQKEQDAARASAIQTHASALSQACISGDVELRVNGPINLQDAPNASNVWVFGGQTVQSVADAQAVAHGKCTVDFMHGNREVTGKLPLGSLDLAASDQTPAAPAN